MEDSPPPSPRFNKMSCGWFKKNRPETNSPAPKNRPKKILQLTKVFLPPPPPP